MVADKQKMHMSVAAARQARVVLVGFEDQENLGLRYLSSRLRQEGHQTRIVTISGGPGAVLDAIRDLDPHIVGFSLIFQYLVLLFSELLTSLRTAGVGAHFTMGGHYPSFEPEALLAAIPELDSVVRFEGEETLLELAGRLANQAEWRNVPGIAYRDGTRVVLPPARPGRMQLDELPWPDRDDIDYSRKSFPMASIIGGRGCPWDCSFCSIINFYAGNGTRGRRRRDPIRVVDEIEYLHKERGARFLFWQDDDFLAGGSRGIEWAHAIGRECIARGLHHNLRWKISCRSDEARLDVLQPLVEAGLTHICLGIESGDADSLRTMNKKETAEDHLRAGEVLRRLGLSFDFGFMLLDPWSTFATLRNNIAFLRKFAGDGAAAVGFVRLLPYVGTSAQARLVSEGRLLPHQVSADYRFLDPRLDAFYNWMEAAFHDRNQNPDGTLLTLRWLLFESHLNMPDYPLNPMFRERVEILTALSTEITLDILENAAGYLENLETVPKNDPLLEFLRQHAIAQDSQIQEELAPLLAVHPGDMQHIH